MEKHIKPSIRGVCVNRWYNEICPRPFYRTGVFCVRSKSNAEISDHACMKAEIYILRATRTRKHKVLSSLRLILAHSRKEI